MNFYVRKADFIASNKIASNQFPVVWSGFERVLFVCVTYNSDFSAIRICASYPNHKLISVHIIINKIPN